MFDDDFSTVDFIRSKKEPSNWENLCFYHTEDYKMEAMPGVQTVDDLHLDLLPPSPTTTAATIEPQSHTPSCTTDDAPASSQNVTPSISPSDDSMSHSSCQNVQSIDNQSATNRQEGVRRDNTQHFELAPSSDSVESGHTSSTHDGASEGAAQSADTRQQSSDVGSGIR